jgi:hypothetical protein
MWMSKTSAFLGVLLLGAGSLASAASGNMTLHVTLQNEYTDTPLATSVCSDSSKSCDYRPNNCQSASSAVTQSIMLVNPNYASSCLAFKIEPVQAGVYGIDTIDADPGSCQNDYLVVSSVNNETPGRPTPVTITMLQAPPLPNLTVAIQVTLDNRTIDPKSKTVNRHFSLNCTITATQ